MHHEPDKLDPRGRVKLGLESTRVSRAFWRSSDSSDTGWGSKFGSSLGEGG